MHANRRRSGLGKMPLTADDPVHLGLLVAKKESSAAQVKGRTYERRKGPWHGLNRLMFLGDLRAGK